MVGIEYGRSPFGYEYHWTRAIVACLAKLIHTALQLEHCEMKTEILESHVPPNEVEKDDYHIERLGRLPKTTIWAPESLREES